MKELTMLKFYNTVFILLLISNIAFIAQIIPVSEKNPFACSSQLPSSKVADYGPENIFDFDPSTAWIEGVKGDGIGEWISAYLGSTDKLIGTEKIFISIYHGYQKSLESFSNNNVPISLLITLFNGTKKISDKLIDTYIYTGEEDSNCWGGFANTRWTFDLPSASLPEGNIWIKIQILKVHPGKKYRDTAISEVMISFEGANPFNVKEEIVSLIKPLVKDNYKYTGEELFILNEKQIALILSGSECDDVFTLFKYEGKKWMLQKEQHFKGTWWSEINDEE